MDIISSNQNQIVKEVLSLKQKKHREEHKKTFIEGTKFVNEALAQSVLVDKVIVSNVFIEKNQKFISSIREKKVPLIQVADKLFREISDTETPQGVLAVIHYSSVSMRSLLTKNCFLLVLEGIQDPGNLGTIIRTAAAAGVTGIILSEASVDAYSPKVLRSTAGAVFNVPICFGASIGEIFKALKEGSVKTFATCPKGGSDYFEAQYPHKTALVIGNEAAGISREALALSDELVTIPMPGKAESLNAAVAASLLMYEVVRQKMGT